MCLSLANNAKHQAECELLIEQAITWDISQINHWCSVHRLLFAGNSYKNLQLYDKSKQLYLNTISWTEKHKCHLNIAGQAKIGLAEISRLQGSFNETLSYHHKSIEILEKIGAKCNLAEAYFQLGLTYQAMGEQDQAKTYKAKALKLFEQMEAPKQIDRVNQAFLLT